LLVAARIGPGDVLFLRRDVGRELNPVETAIEFFFGIERDLLIGIAAGDARGSARRLSASGPKRWRRRKRSRNMVIGTRSQPSFILYAGSGRAAQ
jgi:hypothetical protein